MDDSKGSSKMTCSAERLVGSYSCFGGSPKMTCFGEYLLGNCACDYACQDRKSCLEEAGLAVFPEFLAHPDPAVRKRAKELVEQLRENDGCNS